MRPSSVAAQAGYYGAYSNPARLRSAIAKSRVVTLLVLSTATTQRAICRLPLRTASTTSRIEWAASSACSLCISWPLLVLVMCFAFGTNRARYSRPFSARYRLRIRNLAECPPVASQPRSLMEVEGPRVADSTTKGSGCLAGEARIWLKLQSTSIPLKGWV